MDNTKLQGGIERRLSVIGVPHDAIMGFAALVVKWKTCSGTEWTVSRLKAVKVDLIRARTGLPILSSWIRKNRKGEYTGPIGRLFRWALKSDSNFRKGLQAFMVYSMFTLEKPSQTQINKFVEAVTSSESERLSPSWMRSFGAAIRRHFPLVEIRRETMVSLLGYRGSSAKRAPGFSWQPSTRQDENVIGQANYFYLEDHKVLARQYWSLYRPVLLGLPHHIGLIQDAPHDVVDDSRVVGGRICFLQEAGCKMRSIASPHLVHQLALRHFGDAIYNFIRTLPWDCTHDQSLPFNSVQEHLRDGRTIHSVDLSSATDHFPLSVQLIALRSIFSHQPDIDLFKSISRSTWLSPIGNLRWSKGQPLGLFPSFGSFTLTHGLVLWYLNGHRHNNDFFVVGDDVLILSDRLYDEYIQFLEKVGCPWSPDKSISSSSVAEFAGKLITSDEVLPQMKWREMSNDNFLDLARLLGPRSRSLLSSRQRRIFDSVAHCLSPLGCNMSLPGDNYLTMFERTQQVFGSRNENVYRSLTGLSSVVNQNVFTSEFNDPAKLVDWQAALEIIDTFDEKVKAVLLGLLGWAPEPLQGFASTPRAMGDESLPLEQLIPSRETVLERYERYLQRLS